MATSDTQRNHWERISHRRLGRRALLNASARAGVGAAGLALVGCGGDDDDDSAVADTPADQADQADQAVDQVVDQADQAVDQVVDQAVDDPQPGELTAAEQAEVDAAVNKLEVEFRLRYHWSKLSNLPGHANGPQYGGTLFSHSGPSRSYDLLSQSGGRAATSYSFNGLVYYAIDDFGGAHESVITGDLATGWESPDDSTLTFTIADGVKFHDKAPVNGREMTMEDVRFSYEAHREAPFQSANYASVLSIETSDADRTITFKTDGPDASFLGNLLGIPDVVFAPEMAGTDDFTLNPIGTGPFVTTDLEPDVSIRYERNAEYFQKDPRTGMALPYLDAIEGRNFRGNPEGLRTAFETGDTHMISAFDRIDWEDILERRPDAISQVTSPPASGMVHVGFRLENEPWNDVRVRRALAHAVDRGQMQDGVFLGVASAGYGQLWQHFDNPDAPGTNLEFPWNFSENGEYHQRDPDYARANELLNAAGFNDGNPLKFKYDHMSYTIGRSLDAHRFMLEQWERNLPVEIEATEHELYTWFGKESARDYEDLGGSWNTGLGQQEPDGYSRRVLASQSPGAKYGVQDAEIDDLSDRQRRELVWDDRQEMLLRIKEIDLEEVYRIFTLTAYHWFIRDPGTFSVIDNLNGWAPQGYRNTVSKVAFFENPA